MIDWKDRYAELVDQSERQQTRQKRRQKLLVSGFLSALQLARGLNSDLDTKLLATQRLIRKDDTMSVDLEQGVDALERAADEVLEEREQELSEAITCLRRLSVETRSLGLEIDMTQDLKQLEKKLKKEQVSYQLLLNGLSQLQQLHKLAIQQSKARTRGGFLSRWMTSLDKPAEEEVQEQQAECNRDCNRESNELVEETPALEPKVTFKSVLGSSVKALLQQFGPSEDSASIEAQLSSALKVEEVPELLDSVCILGIEAVRIERAEYQKSLQRINSRLQETANQIGACQTLVEASNQVELELHANLDQSIEDLSGTIHKAKDLESLKTAVSMSLHDMSSVLEAHKGVNGGVTTSLRGLSEQVSHLQDMGRGSLLRVEDQIAQAQRDTQTGLPNRLSFQTDAVQLIRQRPICMAVCRFDELPSQDRVCEFAELLKSHLNQGLFRLDTNLIVIMQPGISTDFAVKLDAIRQAAVAQIKVKLSIGVCDASDNDTAETLLARAHKLSLSKRNHLSLS